MVCEEKEKERKKRERERFCRLMKAGMCRWILLLLFLFANKQLSSFSSSSFSLAAIDSSPSSAASLNATNVMQGVSSWLSGALSTMDSTLHNYTVVQKIEKNVNSMLKQNLTIL